MSWRSHSTQSGPRRLGVANESDKLPTISGFKLLILYVLVYSPPKGVERKYVLPRDGPKHRVPVAWRRRNILVRAPLHQTQHHRPARAWAWRHPLGVVGEPATGCIPYVPPVGGWGRLGASSWPRIRRWDCRRCCRRIYASPGGPEIRWILSVGWCPSKGAVVIHHARPHTAHKMPDGRLGAISGSVSKFGEVARYEW